MTHLLHLLSVMDRLISTAKSNEKTGMLAGINSQAGTTAS